MMTDLEQIVDDEQSNGPFLEIAKN